MIVKNIPICVPCGLLPLAQDTGADILNFDLFWMHNLAHELHIYATPTFRPEQHLILYLQSVRWNAHIWELSHIFFFVVDQIFSFIGGHEYHISDHWTWNSSEFVYKVGEKYVFHETEWI